MKKIFSFFLTVSVLFSLAACSNSAQQEEHSNDDLFFDAKILEVQEENILVEPIESAHTPTENQILVSTNISGTNELPKLETGTEIRIMYGGEISETDPPEIDTVFAIYLLDEIDQ